jgi:ABC-type transport system substrate-binding protein
MDTGENKMKKIGLLLIIVLLIAGCSAPKTPAPEVHVEEPTSIPPTATRIPTETPVPPTPTVTPLPTETLEPTPLPGKMIYPLESLDYGIPWIAQDKSAMPMLVYYGFNVTIPPFNIPEVRQAFAAALDKEVLFLVYKRNVFYQNPSIATSIFPPQTLSLDLTNEVGIPYDPQRARDLLTEAGYEDISGFPEVNLLVVYVSWFPYPGNLVQSAEEAIRMWEENLGISVNLEVLAVDDAYNEHRDLLATGKYAIFEHGVWVDENDPHSFAESMFYPGAYNNFTGADFPEVEKLIGNGSAEVDPAKRLPVYVELDRLLSEELVPIIPLFHCTVDFSN